MVVNSWCKRGDVSGGRRLSGWGRGHLLTFQEAVGSGKFFIWPPGGVVRQRLGLYMPPVLGPSQYGVRRG